MKVVEITKKYRNGENIHHLVVEDHFSNDDIQDIVEDWCSDDSNGQIYGYSGDWKFIEDKSIINKVMLKELGSINHKMDILGDRKIKIETQLNNNQ
jgi:hypothetical protein